MTEPNNEPSRPEGDEEPQGIERSFEGAMVDDRDARGPDGHLVPLPGSNPDFALPNPYAPAELPKAGKPRKIVQDTGDAVDKIVPPASDSDDDSDNNDPLKELYKRAKEDPRF